MTTEQAQQRLEEISRLLMERARVIQEAAAIDAKIAELAGVKTERRPHRKPQSRNDFRNSCGVPS